jgi:hypothetical protein
MKKLAITLITIISLCSTNISQGAEKYKTLVVNATTDSATYNIPAGELCHILYLHYSTAGNFLTATISGTVFTLSGSPNTNQVGTNYRGTFFWHYAGGGEPKNLMIAGPATITLNRAGTDNFCTMRLVPTPNIGGVGQ